MMTIREIRKELGLTQAELGRLLCSGGKRPERQVQRWESGKTPVPPIVFKFLALHIAVTEHSGRLDIIGAAVCLIDKWGYGSDRSHSVATFPLDAYVS